MSDQKVHKKISFQNLRKFRSKKSKSAVQSESQGSSGQQVDDFLAHYPPAEVRQAAQQRHAPANPSPGLGSIGRLSTALDKRPWGSTNSLASTLNPMPAPRPRPSTQGEFWHPDSVYKTTTDSVELDAVPALPKEQPPAQTQPRPRPQGPRPQPHPVQRPQVQAQAPAQPRPNSVQVGASPFAYAYDQPRPGPKPWTGNPVASQGSGQYQAYSGTPTRHLAYPGAPQRAPEPVEIDGQRLSQYRAYAGTPTQHHAYPGAPQKAEQVQDGNTVPVQYRTYSGTPTQNQAYPGAPQKAEQVQVANKGSGAPQKPEKGRADAMAPGQDQAYPAFPQRKSVPARYVPPQLQSGYVNGVPPVLQARHSSGNMAPPQPNTAAVASENYAYPLVDMSHGLFTNANMSEANVSSRHQQPRIPTMKFANRRFSEDVSAELSRRGAPAMRERSRPQGPRPQPRAWMSPGSPIHEQAYEEESATREGSHTRHRDAVTQQHQQQREVNFSRPNLPYPDDAHHVRSSQYNWPRYSDTTYTDPATEHSRRYRDRRRSLLRDGETPPP